MSRKDDGPLKGFIMPGDPLDNIQEAKKKKELSKEDAYYRDRIRKEKTCAYPGCNKPPDGVVENEMLGQQFFTCNDHAQAIVSMQENLNESAEERAAKEETSRINKELEEGQNGELGN